MARLPKLHHNSQNDYTKGHYQKNGSVKNRADSSRGTYRCTAAGNRITANKTCIHFVFLLLEYGSIVSHRKTFVNEKNTTDSSVAFFLFLYTMYKCIQKFKSVPYS